MRGWVYLSVVSDFAACVCFMQFVNHELTQALAERDARAQDLERAVSIMVALFCL